MTERRLIVNADDFGWSRGVNRGIIEAHTGGILTSTTLLVNFPAMDDAIALAGEHQQLGLGLHFNIVHGPPVSPPDEIRSLVNDAGQFPGAACIIRRLMTRRLDKQHVIRELRAQLTRFRQNAGTPTHIDSHKHMHLFSTVRSAIVALSRDMAEMAVRSTARGADQTSPATAKFRVLHYLGGRARPSFIEAGFACADDFIGLDQLGMASPEHCLRLLSSTREGLTEMMCHPGRPSDDEHAVIASVCVTETRSAELTALTDPSVKEFVATQNIKLMHYGDI